MRVHQTLAENVHTSFIHSGPTAACLSVVEGVCALRGSYSAALDGSESGRTGAVCSPVEGPPSLR